MANFKLVYKTTQTASETTETFDNQTDLVTRWEALVYNTNRAYITDSYQLVDGEWQPC